MCRCNFGSRPTVPVPETLSETEYGRATWLRDVSDDGRPIVPQFTCPFSDVAAIKENLKGKDWTRYAGRYHTDQAIRPSLFSRSVTPPDAVRSTEWLLDLTYIYDHASLDHRRLVDGQTIALSEVRAAIGDPDTWVQIASPRRRRKIRALAQRDRSELEGLIERCEGWALSAEEMRNLTASKRVTTPPTGQSS